MTADQLPISLEQNNRPVDEGQLKTKAARSFKWAILYNIVPRLVTPFSTILLAALLSPDDFGLIAVFSLVIALARILVDMGLGKAVIQRKDQVEEAASISFWVCMSIAIITYGVLWAGAPLIAALYHNEKITAVIRISAFALPITALATVPKALLRRDMKFQQLFWMNTSFMILQAVLSVILAFAGMGVWAVVWGQLIGLLISTILAWTFAKWYPKLWVGLSLLGTMIRFSIWVMVSSFQDWVFQYADNAIAGIFLGVQGLGIYSLGFNFATIVPGFLTSAMGDVAYPTFCKMQDYPRQIGENLLKLEELTAAILFPFSFGLSALAPIAVTMLYGNKWPGLDFVIAMLVIMPGAGYVWALNEFAYQAVGRPQMWTKLAGFSLILLIPALWISAPYGLYPFTIVRCIGALVLPLGNLLVGSRSLGIGIKEQIKAISIPLLCSILMYSFLVFLRTVWSPFTSWIGWAKLCIIVLSGMSLYVVSILLLRKELWRQFTGSLKIVLARDEA